jgi:hypothetical protein
MEWVKVQARKERTVFPSGQMPGSRAAPWAPRPVRSQRITVPGESGTSQLSRSAGKLLIIGGSAMFLGCLFSWNLFRVATYHFYGKVVLTSGTRLTVLLLVVFTGFHARSVLLGRISPIRRRRYWATVGLTGSIALLSLSRYADSIQGSLQRWVVDTYSATIAARTATPVTAVKQALQDAIDGHDVYLTLRPGFFIALAGSMVVLIAAALLLVDALRTARAGARGPGGGLKGVLPDDAEG